MPKTVVLGIAFLIGISVINSAVAESAFRETPLPPDTGIREEKEYAEVDTHSPTNMDEPARIIIPSINLDTNIEEVGITDDGEMDVPDGRSKNVGWYEYGTVPGEVGSAVMDAHVYAAFKKLRYAKIGDDVYVVTKGGKKLHFVIEHSMLYEREDVPLDFLFNRNDEARLNLITCAGNYSPSEDTYTHRLIVYTKLIEEKI